MPGTYTEISENEMDELLVHELDFSPSYDTDHAKEKIYDHPFVTKSGDDMLIRVYSSIDVRTGKSRESGNDAIRVVLMWKDGSEWRPVGSSKRVHRIETWRKNLRKRLSNWRDMVEGRCEECGAPMKVRSGQHGKFLGCVRYGSTGCDYTDTYDG